MTTATLRETLGLGPDADEVAIVRAARKVKADADRALQLEEELLAEFGSEEADGLDPESASLHLAALTELHVRGIEEPSEHEYFRALEAAAPKVTTEPLPRAGDPKPMPRRKTNVDVLELDPEDNVDFDEAELRRHRRALEILDKRDYSADEYASALELARKEEARR
jgi:hypothetical protein